MFINWTKCMGATLSTLRSIGDEPTIHCMSVIFFRELARTNKRKYTCGSVIYRVYLLLAYKAFTYVSGIYVQCTWGRMAIGKDSDNIQCNAEAWSMQNDFAYNVT